MEKVDYLAYRLNVPLNWRIHLVFSIAQLELALSLAKDPFGRLFPSNPLFVFVKGNTNKMKSFEIKKLLDKRQIKKRIGQAIKYLVC